MFITGIGWVERNAHGAARRGVNGTHGDLRSLYGQLRAADILPAALESFGRFDPDSKRVCLAVGLALHDAAIRPEGPEAFEAGLLIAGPLGAQNANLSYFRDYLSSGRIIGRGNLFIYTLPTSPAAEAAIAFGLHGPLLYIGRTEHEQAVLHDAAELIDAGQAETMLCVLPRKDTAACYVLGRKGAAGRPLHDLLSPDGALPPPGAPWHETRATKGPA